MYNINYNRNQNSHPYMYLDKPNNPTGMYVKRQCLFQLGKVFVSVDLLSALVTQVNGFELSWNFKVLTVLLLLSIIWVNIFHFQPETECKL